ncbi:MAG: hypothetical protein EGQ63_00040, partial [Clostridiales bacterium]|nr:hypothetical protein [Clostridiales bacterium]
LKLIIDNRKSNDSFNVALIGAWGSGKTSITDTLIYEYEKQDNRYFILKISTLTLKETKNIVTYVKNYFEDLFRKYEIGIAGRNVAFLATLANTFSEQLSINELFYNTSGNSFLDIEKERQFFVKQISNLLKVSGRKNILFLIDDTDRGDDEEQIIKLLSEFASINGIISVVSLDKQKDISAYSSKMDKDNIYNYIDKFIHVRIRIIDDNHIEYNQNITNQILCSFEKIEYKTNCYIQCDYMNTKYSLYDSLKEYQTTEVVKKRVLSTSTYNILTEIFLYNLKYNLKNFGSYLEELIKEYIYNSKEIQPYIQEIMTKPIDKWEKELLLISAQWTDLFKIQVEDSLIQLQNNLGNLFWTLTYLIESLDMIENNGEIEKDIKNIRDVYEYLIIKKFPIDGRTWENRTEQEVSYTGLQQLELVAFSKQQYLEINTYIEKGNYQKVKKILIEKIEGVANLYFALFILNDFMDYVRNVLNNYRSFKMQLRETELINRNYLDYLIKDWQPRENILENFQKNNPILQNINIIVPSLDTFINNILFQSYILKYGGQFYNGEIENSKLFLYHVKNSKPLIVIVKERKGQREYLYLDISGNKCELDEELKTEIRKNYNELMD